MNDEIKEILDWLKDEDIYIEDYGYQYKRISLKETKQLLDYITNLQQDTEMYAQLKDEYEEEIKDLKQENESLKEYLFKSANNTNMIMELYEHYKSRCENAIEYINNFKKYFLDRQPFVDTRHIDLEYLLNILQGEEK